MDVHRRLSQKPIIADDLTVWTNATGFGPGSIRVIDGRYVIVSTHKTMLVVGRVDVGADDVAPCVDAIRHGEQGTRHVDGREGERPFRAGSPSLEQWPRTWARGTVDLVGLARRQQRTRKQHGLSNN